MVLFVGGVFFCLFVFANTYIFTLSCLDAVVAAENPPLKLQD